MKTLKLVLVLLFFTIMPTYSQWQYIDINSSIDRLQDINAADNLNIWAISRSVPTYVFRSTNGGFSWLAAGSLPEQSYFISSVNGNNAWVSSGSGNIYKTSNGGLNWVDQNYSPKSFINHLHFFNSNTGYFISDAVNDTVGFFYTRDGGTNWKRSTNSPLTNYAGFMIENTIGQLDTNLIWICSNTGSGYKFFKLMGGFESTWQVFTYAQTGFFRYAVFKDTLNGFAADQNKIITTTNGGANWNLSSLPLPPGIIVDIFRVPGTNWVVLAKGNSINISKDFCQSWAHTSTFDLTPGYGSAYDSSSIWLSYYSGKGLKYNFGAIGIENIGNNVADKFDLKQNYPNPFNPSTKIGFSIPSNTGDIQGIAFLQVYDVSGKLIESRSFDKLARGVYEVDFDGSRYSSGIYFYKLTSGKYSVSRKMILLK
ncbi:MAG: T9SS type A sorting domain-containing protein [Ignavibacteria bacterium]|nr:T9SS type A sorting domain-containing protein [Ignavibacteria bacterium]